MLAVERKNRILTILQEEKRVVVGELSKLFGVSEETIRRDLEKLEKEGLVVKAYGGAVLNENNQTDMPFMVRKKTNVIGKQKIADIISDLIKDGDHIMLDSSTTALFIVKKIKDRKNITLITNSLEILIELKDVKSWKIFSSGGLLGDDSLALVGNQADKMLADFHVNRAIVSCKGFDINKGFTDSNEMHASTKKTMLENADQRILAVDSSKFNRIAFNLVGNLNDINMIVTDVRPPEEWLQKFKAANVECHYPEEETEEVKEN